MDERIKETQIELDAENGKTLKSIQLELRLDKMKNNRNTHLNNIETYKNKKEEFDKLDLFEIGTGKNTHRIGSKGFKNGVPRTVLTDWKLEFRGDKMDYLSYRNTGRGVPEEEWDKKMKGKTIIHSNITKNSDDDVKELENEIKHVWNNVLTNKQREGVDVLQIKYSEKPTWKVRSSKTVRTLGTHSARKVFDYGSNDGDDRNIMVSPSVLTINISKYDKPNDVLNTMIHEVSHSMWATSIKHNHEKVNAFTNKILEMGKEGALTEYAGSYFDDLEEIKAKAKKDWEERIEYTKNIYGKAPHQTEEEFQNWKNEQILQDLTNQRFNANEGNENILRAQRLIANETHSEYFGMVGSPTMDSYHTVDTVKLQKMSTLIKEILYD